MSKISRLISTLTLGVLFFLITLEFYKNRPSLWIWLGKFTLQWWVVVLFILVTYALTFTIALVIIWLPQRTIQRGLRFFSFLDHLSWARWPIAIGIALIPTYLLLFTSLGSIFSGPYLRILLLVCSSALFAVITTNNDDKLVNRNQIFLGLTLVGSMFSIGAYLSRVTNYPFALSWSEGNRLYDYSLSFASHRYILENSAISQRGGYGRNILWGILFLIPDIPIWLHRLWNALLWTVPYLILGILIARRGDFMGRGKWVFTLWVFLFLTQGPIYTPLILSAILIVLMVRQKYLVTSLIGAFLAGFYASASRWTWVLAPAAWCFILMIPDSKADTDSNLRESIKSMAPSAIIAFTAVAGGILGNPKVLFPKEISSGISFSQPLLWNRLIPNPTYTPGILLGVTIATAPLIALLFWFVATGRWKINWVQGLSYLAISIGFLSLGLVASTKIGGGSNLHNLDMLFVTLVIITGLATRCISYFQSEKWPIWTQSLLFLLVFIPCWNAIKSGTPLLLPSQDNINEALEIIATKVYKAQEQGEVLFIDQRQLLTFGIIKNLPLVPEYEKKFLMDQAMAGNEKYLEQFYRDLANQRFSMIISDPLFTSEKGQTQVFAEENNAWINQVSRPILCYYVPIVNIPEVNVQLLLPRENPRDCH